MYHVNPFTYVVGGFLGTSLANAPVHCASNELVQFSAPGGSTCDEYMSQYIANNGGYLLNPYAGNGTECQYCPMSNTNTFLKSVNISFDNRWRDFGFMWVYCIFNLAATVGLYWLARMPKNKKIKNE